MAKFCPNCGNSVEDNAEFCNACGANLSGNQQTATNTTNQSPTPAPASGNGEAKSKLVAGLLGIFLGCLGIHNFYLGYTKKGVIQLILGTVGALLCGIGTIAAGIWALVEAIQIFTGTINVDANGVPLKD